MMDEKEKELLVRDIESFLSPQAQRWYGSRGIPYRRGYLFYGPPGTGKSSLSLSVAGCFGLEIYTLSLSGIDGTTLGILFRALPDRCVVLLEDIDAVGSTSTREDDPNKPGGSEPSSKQRVSLSALLNALDGVASQDGRVLIMSTNYIERLDAALIRPGRVDKKVALGLADRSLIIRIFDFIFRNLDDDASHEKEELEVYEATDQPATKFADQVPESKYSPAEILSFLLAHRHSPVAALDNVQEWMDKTDKERKAVKRADSWMMTE